jgi:hypothetical protein
MFFYPYEMWRVLVSNIMRNAIGESMKLKIPCRVDRGNTEINHYRDKRCYDLIIDRVKRNRGYSLAELEKIEDGTATEYKNCLVSIRHRILDSSDIWLAGVWQAYYDGVVHRTNGPQPLIVNYNMWCAANIAWLSLLILCFGSGYVVWRKTCGVKDEQ